MTRINSFDPLLPNPAHYNPANVAQVWRVPYQVRAGQARRWAEQYGVRPASQDDLRVALLAIDVQNTFCIPGYELFVAGTSGRGAVDDNQRLCEFIYANLALISNITTTQDSHQPAQIFHEIWLIDDEGRHPQPLTSVSYEDVRSGRWRFNTDLEAGLGFAPGAGQAHLEHYTQTLQAQGKFDLTIWPYHGLSGGLGHALVSAFEEAVFFHSIARSSTTQMIQKGTQPLTEHYSAVQPEVLSGSGGQSLGARNPAFRELLESNDALVIAGQAKSHCLNWTVSDLIDGLGSDENDLLSKIYLLEDCTSPVVIPGIVDFSEAASAAFADFAAAGLHVVRSSTPVHQWPGWPAHSTNLLANVGRHG